MITYDSDLDLYEVPSSTIDLVYDVFFSISKNQYLCNCKGFCLSYRYSGHCRHVRLVLYYIDKLKKENVSFFLSKKTGLVTTQLRCHSTATP